LEKLFSSLQDQTFSNFELVFVDNASTDDSLRLANAFAKKRDAIVSKTIVALSNNFGFCKGNNTGIEHTKGTYIALLNNDTYVSHTWLEELVSTMDSNSSVGICQSQIIDIRNKLTINGNFLGVYGKRNGDEPFKNDGHLFEGAFYASGTALVIRRALVEKMGYLFDEKQFTGDMDLSWRARLIGYRIVTNCKSICYHYQGHSSRLVLRNEVDVGYVVFRDAVRTFIKNYALSSLFFRIPILMLIDAINSFYVSIQSRSMIIHSLAKAVFWNLINLKSTWKEHVKTQVNRRVTDGEIESYMLSYPAELYFFKLKLLRKK